jgi:hypothetical protein
MKASPNQLKNLVDTTTHGHCIGGWSPEYSVWQAAKKRISNPNSKYYERYGGRGISMCARWFNSFENFLKDMGPRPDGYCLERIDNDGNYEPGNCKWATRLEQLNNTSINRRFTFQGQDRTFSEWARILGVGRNTIKYRVEKWGTLKRL